MGFFHKRMRHLTNIAIRLKLPQLQPAAITSVLVLLFLAVARVAADNYPEAKKAFQHPTPNHSSGPLWVWNDRLTDDQIIGTLRDLHGQQVRQVFVHPRPGLMTPYLSAEWFHLWDTALKEAGRLGMNVWIYDENSYPSGFAGGFVPDQMPESRGRGLALRESAKAPAWSEAIFAVYRLEGASFANVTELARRGESKDEGRYFTASVLQAGDSPWTGGKSYVDLLRPGVTEKFLEITLGSYQKNLGKHFGKLIPGVFTDEPNIRPAGGLPWTPGLPALFEKRWGYKLEDHLPSLNWEVGDWQRVRHNYYQLLTEQFIEHWGKPYHDYCAQNHLEWTGHYWDHEWPNTLGVPDNMAMYAWHQRPAIDVLMNQYHEDTHAQFGNARIVKELSSVANQLGMKRTLCEAYGAGGWDLRFEDMKRIGDWLYVLGVNTLDQHLSYITIRGARKRDHPQSFSYHEPWWPEYHVSGQYFEHLTAALCQGEQINPTLVIEPTTTAWIFNKDAGASEPLKQLGNSFFDFVMRLERAQVEYDLGCEDILTRHGSVEKGRLIVGQRRYSTIVLPPRLENLNASTFALLEKFLQQGGSVLSAEAIPSRIDGRASADGKRLAQASGWRALNVNDLVGALAKQQAASGFALVRDAGDQGILFHHRRQLADGELLFLVNTSLESTAAGAFESTARGVENRDLNTGATGAFAFSQTATGVKARFELPPAGSRLLWLSHKAIQPVAAPEPGPVAILPPTATAIRRHEPNLLVLDYVDITAGGETRTNLYFYRAGQFAFQKNGMKRNPWDSAVQFKNELITKTFPAGSGFEARYKFTLAGAVPEKLSLVIERPDLYSITCNGQPVTPTKGAWWLDKAFGVIDLASSARAGENVVTLKASPFTIYHELESAYVLGDFSVKATDKGFEIQPAADLQFGKWNEQGHPFYSAGVVYQEQFDIQSPKGQFQVHVPAWLGSVARVTVNGKPAGHLVSQPWDCDVTRHIHSGVNTIEIEVIGTLKNTLGPHHAGAGLGSAWPGMFQTAPESGQPPGAQYATVGYGLFKPFVLRQTAPR